MEVKLLNEKVAELEKRLQEEKDAHQKEKTARQNDKANLERSAKESMMKYRISINTNLMVTESERDEALEKIKEMEKEIENKEDENNLLRVTGADKDNEILAANQRIADLETRLNAALAPR